MSKVKFLTFCLLSLLLAGSVQAYANPGKPTGFVNDYTNTLSTEQKQNLENKLTAFKQQSGNEIAIAIIPTLDGDTIENFANELFKDWGIGQKGKDNGVLILVAKEDRKMRIEVGYGLESSLTDAQSNWIINNQMKPAFQANDFYGGLDQAVDKIIAATQGEVIPTDTGNNQQNKVSIFNFFWLIIFAFIWLASILGRSKSWWLGGVLGGIGGVIIGFFQGFLYFGIISIAVLIPVGLLFDFIVSKKYHASKAIGIIPWWIGGGRGGSGGIGGGGFGGFGGGMSGGGGSSGSW